METKPIKRNKNIVPFSKEHHGALLFCWKIRWGVHLNTPAERMARYVKWFWENCLKPHQEEEDRLLFANTQDALVLKVVDEHFLMIEKFEDIISGKKKGSKDFLDLADFIEDHTRYEERILFPHLETVLSDEQLEKIGTALAQDGREHTADEDYPDEFWRERN